MAATSTDVVSDARVALFVVSGTVILHCLCSQATCCARNQSGSGVRITDVLTERWFAMVGRTVWGEKTRLGAGYGSR